MTALLQRAFEEASKRSAEEQDFLATMLLAELEAEDAFDQAIAATADKLGELSRQAIEEGKAGLSKELILDGPTLSRVHLLHKSGNERHDDNEPD